MLMMTTTTTYRSQRSVGADELDRCLSGIVSGHAQALEDLYHHTSAAVYSFALSMLKNTHDAEDVLQDCYLNIYAGAESYRSSGKPMAWILTIAKNLCFQKLRERQKIADLSQEDWEHWLTGNEGISPEDKMVIQQCMKLLSDEQRQIVTLHAVAGFRHREIAELLDLPVATVLSKYHRAIKKLRQSL